jgi:hypothetical protein
MCIPNAVRSNFDAINQSVGQLKSNLTVFLLAFRRYPSNLSSNTDYTDRGFGSTSQCLLPHPELVRLSRLSTYIIFI